MLPAHKIGSLVSSGHYSKVRCAECGGEFHLPCARDKYRFRIGEMLFFCKWSCKRKYEEKHNCRRNFYRDYLA